MQKRTIRVLVLATAFHGGARRRAGTEFDMEVEFTDQGVPKLPSWARLANDTERKAFKDQQKIDAAKFLDAAIGTSERAAASKAKLETFGAVMSEAGSTAEAIKIVASREPK